MPQRILYYNWCPIVEKVGGGIAVYQKNLFHYFQENCPDLEAFLLTSGFYYDRQKDPYIRQESHGKNIYSIVNSPVYAPIQTPTDNIEKMLEEPILTDMFERFLREKGPFDAVHFQTLEGLPLSVFPLKEKFPQTKFIYSIHNYMLFCPNVQLWTCDSKNCMTVKKFNCGECMRKYRHPATNHLKQFRELITADKRKPYLLSRVYSHLFYRLNPPTSAENIAYAQQVIEKFRNRCIDYVNRYMDEVLAVSERVREIALYFGLRKDLVKTSYIGTRFASLANYQAKPLKDDGLLRLVYMGYMRKEKGFYFFLNALEKLDSSIAGKIVVTFASKIQDPVAYIRMKKLKKKFNDIIIYNGYTHDIIGQILGNSDLGVVPVLWEDNLPQVAIEMIANGVPVLASDFGGPSELNSNPHFRYQGGNEEDFLEKLTYLFHHPILLKEYWDSSKTLTSMAEHISYLRKIYGERHEL